MGPGDFLVDRKREHQSPEKEVASGSAQQGLAALAREANDDATDGVMVVVEARYPSPPRERGADWRSNWAMQQASRQRAQEAAGLGATADSAERQLCVATDTRNQTAVVPSKAPAQGAAGSIELVLEEQDKSLGLQLIAISAGIGAQASHGPGPLVRVEGR